MQQVTTKAKRWTETGELDCQPEDATSAGGVAVCRLRLVQHVEGEPSIKTVLYVTGRLAERCRDGLNEGDRIEAIGLVPPRQREGLRYPEVVIPDQAGAVKLRRRSAHILAAAKGSGRRPSEQRRIVHCKTDPYDIYIGRGNDPRTGEPGRWGMLYSHKPSKVPGVIQVRTAEEAIKLFERDFWTAIKEKRFSLDALAELDGKTLGCWHEDRTDAWRAEFEEGPRGDREPCHGHVLIRAAAWAKQEIQAQASRAA